MGKEFPSQRIITRTLQAFGLLAVLALAGCHGGYHAPPPAGGPPPGGGGYEPPPDPRPEPGPRPRRSFSNAKFQGKPYCPKGSFFDPRKRGQCWSCDGKRRTAAPVTSPKACVKPAEKSRSHARRGRKTKLAWQCKAPWFWDIWKGGACWQCPRGYRRGVSHIKSAKACVRKIRAQHSRARYVANFGCEARQFFDPRRGGQCWSCPRGYRRTMEPVTSATACRRRR